ncbi:MFS transporter [Paenibacillus pseudetheri]|uniref:Multidrug efflux pump SdrM n=1 Tax=Paenibacillus pseudetheri TaxID=2897682 RepID=A0ABN8FFH5_9BACL|nr:MFS transporter [Paenibacillus pseudetheri]CAH1056803.1 Multidrug efflux pump SdrM [Paenibacillus pseudetheri]
MRTNNNKIGIFDAPYRALTIGIILAVTTVAFEGLGVTTIAPKVAHSMNAIHYYGWIFSAFLLSQIIGTMVIGQQIDKNGVYKSFIVSILIFVTGIIIAATSFNIYMLIGGRAFQGFGAGALLTCVYSSITLSYPDSLRTKILAAFSSAYILPALIGPYIAGLLAENLSWRFVFWLVLPFIVLSVCLTLPLFRKLQTENTNASSTKRRTYKEIYAIILTLGTGLLLAGLGFLPYWKGIGISIAGGLIMIQPLRKLLPEGALEVRKGLPATIVTRALFVACYYAVESYVVLALTNVKGLSADVSGLIVAAGAISWSVAAWLQSKLDEQDHGRGRKQRVMIGVAFMIVGVALVITVIGISGNGIVLAVFSQVLTGFGIGLAHPTTGAIALQHAEHGDAGSISANIQFIDAFSPALSIGLGGALITISETFGWGVMTGILLALSIQLLFIILSFIATFRIAKKAS